MDLFDEPWPFWLGAIALAVVSVGFAARLRRGFGVSGTFARVLDPVRELRDQRTRRALADQAALKAALAAATRARFGDDAVPDAEPPPAGPRPAADGWITHVVFIVSIAIGGFLGALGAGRLGQSTYDGAFARLVGEGPLAVVALVAGGALVGFGTQMAGGCTSGHGLTGCSRAEKGSLLATMTFFGTGIVVSLVLEAVLG